MIYKAFYILFFLITIFGCRENYEDQQMKFIKDLSEDEVGRPAFGYDRLNDKLELFSLQDISSGYDSLLIRIWYEPQLLMTVEVIELKYTSKKWTGEHTLIRQSIIQGTDSSKMEKFTNHIVPENGWKHLINQLYNNDIISIPNMRSIQGLEDGWTDGVCYNVEIATKNFYRYYSYHLPEYFQDKYEPARKMVNILKIIEAEVGIENLYLRKESSFKDYSDSI